MAKEVVLHTGQVGKVAQKGISGSLQTQARCCSSSSPSTREVISGLEERVCELERRLAAMQPLFDVEDMSSKEFTAHFGEWEYFVRRQQSLVSPGQLLPDTGKGRDISLGDVVKFAKYVYHEIPIRLARRGKDLDRLPYGLSHMKSIRKVHSWYFQSFVAMRRMEEPENFQSCIDMLPVLRDV